ncbi:uncharacterized protein LOC142322309 isoform X2 [Lycorma delicatula]|uniref:uncharacterized protein LOC142322309 isoform X2 n=1 Tax=Lycorma delicatula TaxID=130591 RepID=UPI003F51051F
MAMSSSKDESDGKEKQSQSSLSLIAALKDGNYVLAEEMIQDPVHGSRYLDEDARGGVKPLAMVMFGVLPGELIHLYLAKLMVEHGVDVNYRIREFGYISRFSCFEQLIDLILDVNRDLKRQNFDVPHMIGMNNQPVKSWTEARLHLIKLLKVFLEFRGNPNFRSRILGCTLFHKILRSSNPDVDVIRILHHAGGDINKVPIFGFPPIVSMANNSFFDSDLQIVKEIWKPTQYKTYHHTFSGSNLVRRITTVANSALMVSMHTGSTETAIFFLKQGAQFDTVGIYNTNVGARYTISCLFLPLLHLSLSYFKYFAAVSLNTNEKYLKDDVFMRNHLEYDEKNCNKSLMCKVVKSSLSPIVDYIVEHSLSSEEDISRDDISEQDINSLIIRYSSYSSGIFCHQFSFTYLLSALFGQSTATLQQLCVRKIFDSIFFTKPTLDTQKLIHRLKYSDFSDFSFLAELFIPDVKFMVNNITDVVIKNLVNCLQLPPKLSILFHLEAARLQFQWHGVWLLCSCTHKKVHARLQGKEKEREGERERERLLLQCQSWRADGRYIFVYSTCV